MHNTRQAEASNRLLTSPRKDDSYRMADSLNQLQGNNSSTNVLRSVMPGSDGMGNGHVRRHTSNGVYLRDIEDALPVTQQDLESPVRYISRAAVPLHAQVQPTAIRNADRSFQPHLYLNQPSSNQTSNRFNAKDRTQSDPRKRYDDLPEKPNQWF
jgi:hypothetical protein